MKTETFINQKEYKQKQMQNGKQYVHRVP